MLNFPQKIGEDKDCDLAISRDIDAFNKFKEEIETEIETCFVKTAEILASEVEKERRKVLNILHKLHKRDVMAANHLEWSLQRVELWKDRLHKEYEKQLKKIDVQPRLDTVEVKEGKVWFGLDAILSVLLRVSTGSPGHQRNFLWEKSSYSFLVDNIFDRALRQESQGYFLREKVDSSTIEKVVSVTLALLTSLKGEDWQGYSSAVKGIWVDTVLPQIYGGTDPDWLEGECWSESQVEEFLNNKDFNPTFFDTVNIINKGKYS